MNVEPLTATIGAELGGVRSRMDATNLADLYDSPLLDWDRITARLDQGLTQAPGRAARTGTPAGWRRSIRTGART